ncbi:MAG: hypothetical protein ACR2MA_01180 [Egibacteraceae bacterium]
MSTSTDDARTIFLARLIDDAGLFPPARLPMVQAVDDHGARGQGTTAWMQGRFLCPASRLDELAGVLKQQRGRASWRVGAILDGPGNASTWQKAVEADLASALELAALSDGRAYVDAVEVRLPDGTPRTLTRDVTHLTETLRGARLPEPVLAYLELPINDGFDASLATLAAIGPKGPVVAPRAKLRCGGVHNGDVPSVERVAAFLTACHRHGVAFKATAGLHQPLPHDDPATGDRQHGFLGVLGGAVLLHAGAITPEDLPTVLTETDPRAWRLDADGLGWRDHRATARAIADAREQLVAGFGSCSFDEPTQALRALGLLPTGANA